MALRGINLGGWLVAERWMTPKLFEGVSGEGERALGRELATEVARTRVLSHREDFITEEDFRWISAHGFDFVRLPFGYWLFEEADGYVSGEEYVSRAFKWAQRHNLKVLLDFHGLQGSQNGNDHSGEVGRIGFYDSGNTDSALATIEKVTRVYGDSENLLGIEVINEPALPKDLTPLLDYYEQAYAIIAGATPPTAKVVVGDGFQHARMIRALKGRNFGDRLVVDVHLYQLFTEEERNMTLAEHLKKVEEWERMLRVEMGGQALVGEWTAALPDKAFREGDPMEALEVYYRAQKNVFDRHTWAQSIWTYKVPGNSRWSFRDLSFASGGVK